MSTVPGDESVGMYSWFPIFFPLSCKALRVYQGDEIAIGFKRRVGGGRVWYEWDALVCDSNSRIRLDAVAHNLQGKGSFIGL